MKSWTSCKSNQEGNLANFSMVTSSLEQNALLEEILLEKVCTKGLNGVFKIPVLKNYFGCKTVCGQMRSQIAVLTSSLCNTPNYRNPCNKDESKELLFIGFDDLANESHFADQFGNDFKINKTEMQWLDTNPNGFENENCLAVNSQDSNQVFDAPCSSKAHPICNITQDPVYSVLGNTDKFGINPMERFLITFNSSGPMLYLAGFNDSKIILKNGKWVWETQGQIMATRTSLDGTPFGKNNWQFYDKEKFNEDLNVHACTDDEYPCNDGTCIGKWFRCDEVQQCEDGSDENYCNLFSLSSGYNPAMPPSKSAEAFDIHMFININQILKLDLQENTYEVKFYLQMVWRDRRVKFNNLLNNRKMKFLSVEDAKKLWSPQVLFRNHRNPDETDSKGNSLMSATLLSKQHLNHDNTLLNRNFVYDGKDVILALDKEYAPELLCKYELGNFPFDQHVCYIEISFIHTDNNTRYNLSTHLRSHKFSAYSLQLGDHSSEDVKYLKIFKIPIVLVANVRPVLMNTYMPTTLLTFITQMTNYLELPEMFEMSTTVNTTVLLTLSALFVAVFNR